MHPLRRSATASGGPSASPSTPHPGGAPERWQRKAAFETARVLEAELSARIQGEVRFDDVSRMLYSTDASNYQIEPIGVVIPRSADDVIAAVELADQPQRADPAARRWLIAGRANGGRGAGDRHVEVPEPGAELSSRRRSRSRSNPASTSTCSTGRSRPTA